MQTDQQHPAKVENGSCPYPVPLADIRSKEYPALRTTTYLDHAGTTPPPQSAINAFAREMNTHLFGNPHSASPSSRLSTERIESVRRQVLAFFKADPEHFDLAFVANATAAVKLVIECVTDYASAQRQRGNDKGFWYGYHGDCHTSLVGPRELAQASAYFGNDSEVERWLSSPQHGNDADVGIFAYPAQSNMNGRRLPLDWPGRLRRSSHPGHRNVYSLLHPAAFISTAQLDLSDPDNAPDFVSLSFYKTFGYPDIGGLIVRKEAGHILAWRRYLGGGTVDMVINHHEAAKAWHARKQSSLHEVLEDGTPAFMSTIALGCALQVHRTLYGSMSNVSRHTNGLVKLLYNDMSALAYANGQKLCVIYTDPSSTRYEDSKKQGPTIAFNVKSSDGRWIGKTQFERAAITANIQLRTGGVCNPGGIATALGLSPAELRDNFAEGVRCGNSVDERHGKPTGIVRVSLGAMTNLEDVHGFLRFLKAFAERDVHPQTSFALSGQGSELSAINGTIKSAKEDLKIATPMKQAPISPTRPTADSTAPDDQPFMEKHSGDKRPLWRRIWGICR